MKPRLRAMAIQEAREDPRVEIGDRLSGAAQSNDALLVKALLEQRADPNHIHPRVTSRVPLCLTSDVEVAKVLLDHPGTDVNVADMNRMTILENMLLHHRKNTGLVSALLAHKDLDVHRGKSLATGARFASAEVLGFLLAHPGVNVNDPRAAFLHHALARTDRGAIEVVEMLLQRPGLDINMHLVGEGGGAAPLHFLSRRDSVTIEIGENEKEVLRSVAARQIEMMKLLLARPGLNVNIADAQGATALHAACAAGRADLVRGFLEDGRCKASAFSCDMQGRTPLDRAVLESQLQRPRWNPLPSTAKHAEVICLLSTYQRAQLREFAPPALNEHLMIWDVVVDFCVGGAQCE